MNRNNAEIAKKSKDITKIQSNAFRINRDLNSSERNSIARAQNRIAYLQKRNAQLIAEFNRL